MGNSIIEAQICLAEEQEKLERLRRRIYYHQLPNMKTIEVWELDWDDIELPKKSRSWIKRTWDKLRTL